MKFGKRMQLAQRADFTYIDYKALKILLKQLSGPPESGPSAPSAIFRAELHRQLSAVNACFVEKEQQFLSALPRFNGEREPSAPGSPAADCSDEAEDEAASFFADVSALYSFVVLK